MESIQTNIKEQNNDLKEASKNLTKIHKLIYNKKFEKAASLLDEAIKLYKDEPAILIQFEIKRVILLIKQGKYNTAINIIDQLQEKYKVNNEIVSKLESIRLKAYLELGMYETVLRKIPELIKKYPEKLGLFESQRMEAYLKSGREKFVAENALNYAEKYPELEKKFIMLRFKGLMALGRYEEIYSLNPEDVRNDFNRNDVIKYGRSKVEALARDGKINEAIKEIDSLCIVYHARKSFFSQQIQFINRKIEEDKIVNLKSLIEENEDEFMKHARNMDIEHFTFLQVARYKHEKRNKIAMATIEEYKRRLGENANLDFAKKLKQMAVVKKRAFDFMKWINLSKTLKLSFETNIQEFPDLSSYFELDR